jgi:hypothetical protein
VHAAPSHPDASYEQIEHLRVSTSYGGSRFTSRAARKRRWANPAAVGSITFSFGGGRAAVPDRPTGGSEQIPRAIPRGASFGPRPWIAIRILARTEPAGVVHVVRQHDGIWSSLWPTQLAQEGHAAVPCDGNQRSSEQLCIEVEHRHFYQIVAGQPTIGGLEAVEPVSRVFVQFLLARKQPKRRPDQVKAQIDPVLMGPERASGDSPAYSTGTPSRSTQLGSVARQSAAGSAGIRTPSRSRSPGRP